MTPNVISPEMPIVIEKGSTERRACSDAKTAISATFTAESFMEST
jgi:hypothetical protein